MPNKSSYSDITSSFKSILASKACNMNLMIRCWAAAIFVASLGIVAHGSYAGTRLEQQKDATSGQSKLRSMNPGCSGTWSNQKLTQWIGKDFSWLPSFDEAPFKIKKTEMLESLTKKYYEAEIFNLKANFHNQNSIFSSVDLGSNEILRQDQTIWLDIDGDKICDFIGWSFEYDADGPAGPKGETRYYFFLQKKSGFKLIDYTVEPCSDSGHYCNGQVPDALQPVWIGETNKPHILTRVPLRFVSGFSLDSSFKYGKASTNGDFSMQWDPLSTRWTSSFDKKTNGQLLKYLRENPFPPAACQNLSGNEGRAWSVDCLTNN